MTKKVTQLNAVFYRTENDSEPVREWLKDLLKFDKKAIGEDIKTVQFGWPLGMPLVDNLGHGSWVMGHGSWVMGHGSWVMGHGSWVMGYGRLGQSLVEEELLELFFLWIVTQ